MNRSRPLSPDLPRAPDPLGARAGFTLLELMIATLLMAVVLMATWSLLGIYRNQLERNQQRTERSQLMRSLRQRLEEDLRSCLVGEINESREAPTANPLSESAASEVDTANPLAESAASEVVTETPSEPAPSPAPSLYVEPNDPFTDPAESVGPDLAAEISQQLWLAPVVGLRGNSQGLVLDLLKPLEPPMASDTELSDDQQAEIPDIVRRVIYVFTDESTAQRQGRPAGLLRCEWTDRELLVLRSAAGQSDLFDLLRSIVPDWPEVESDESMTTYDRELTQPRPSDLSPQLQTEFDTLGRDVSQRVDLLPEITTFRLRFFDGGGWQDRWDSQQQKSLPVAVELRFELAPLEPREDQVVEIDPVTGEPLEPEEAPPLPEEPADTPVEPLDPSLMSAQSQSLLQQDQRVVLFLQPPQGSSSLAEPSEANDLGSAAGFDEGPP